MTANKNENIAPSKSKRLAFISVTLLFPILLLAVLEFLLQMVNYDGNLRLFVDAPEGYEQYLMINPQIGKRFFYHQETLPNPQNDIFLKKKPANGYRIFLIGGSSAAGYPYGSNLMFSRQLNLRLNRAYPDRRIEVINVSTAAINSYSLFDFIDEILARQPDLLMIYAGHNEYYGALGVGSSESFAASPTLTRLGLRLQRIKTVRLIRNGLADLIGLFAGTGDQRPSATLMERLVAEQTIPFGSALYKAGLDQFQSNMQRIIAKARTQGVPVLLSELVSNVRDQRPFVSVKSATQPAASAVYRQAIRLERSGQFAEALAAYKRARDLDGLRFRASSDVNKIIHDLATKNKLPLVKTESIFERAAANGLPGDNLFVDHLHPNIRGYHLLSQAFFDAIIRQNFMGKAQDLQDVPAAYTEIDSLYGAIRIRILKGGWPFKPKAAPNNALIDFVAHSKAESLAVQIWQEKSFTLEQAHVRLAQNYLHTGSPAKALAEYKALIALTPYNLSPRLAAADVLIKQKAFDAAYRVLQASLKIAPSSYAYKWMGQILLNKNRVAKAIPWLEKAFRQEAGDLQLAYNLAGAYALQKQYKTALVLIEKVVQRQANFPGARQLKRQLEKAINN